MSGGADPLSRLRHELRTPLNHIIGYGEMLAEDLVERRPDLAADCRRLHVLGHDVLGLVNQTLDLTVLGVTARKAVDAIVALAETVKKRAEAAGEAGVAADVHKIATSAEDLRALLQSGAAPVASIATPAADAAPTSAVDGAHRATILVVDDDAGNRDVLTRRLVREGYAVRQAGNGRDALLAVETGGVDLILLDVMMPEMDGVEVLRRMKADDALRDLPVLMISALSDMEHVVRSIELGADDYLPKPFDPVLLRARIGSCLEKKRLRDQERRHVRELAEWNRTLERRVADKVHEVERMGQLTRFVAPQLAEAILAGGDDPLRPHRREIVVVFLDIGGFVPFAETSEPEEMIGLLREYHEEMGALILAHEGTLERVAGDFVIVVFNDPVEVPNPAERAVRMALAMRDRFVELAAGWRRRGWELSLGIGVAQGFATIGATRIAGRMDYGAMGRVMGVGYALCDAAKVNRVLVTGKVAATVEAIAELVPVEGVKLGGVLRRFEVFDVLRLRSARTPAGE